MEQPGFTSSYRIAAARAADALKTKTLLHALVSRLRTAFSGSPGALTVTYAGGAAPHVLIRDYAAVAVGRVMIDDETGLYVFCEFGDHAADAIIVTASENRLTEEIALHLCDGCSRQRSVDTAVGSLVGQTMEDVERKRILQTPHHCDGDSTHAAFMLGMPLVTLCNKLAVYFADPVGDPSQAAETGQRAVGCRL